MSKKKFQNIILVTLTSIVVSLILGFLIYLIYFRQDNISNSNKEVIPAEDMTINDILKLDRNERLDYFLQAVWGEDYKQTKIGIPLTHTPWKSVNLSDIVVGDVVQLEALTYTIYHFAPSLLSSQDKIEIPLPDGTLYNLKAEPQVFTRIEFNYDFYKKEIIVKGFRNGNYFELPIKSELE